MAEVSVNVRCSGRMHKISIMPGGAFVLHNHTKAEIAAERILIVLGGEPCRCVQILDVWRQPSDRCGGKEKFLPVGLRPGFREAMALSRNRKQQRQRLDIMHIDKLMTPIDVRTKNRGTHLIRVKWLKVPYVHTVRLMPRDGFNVRATCFLMTGHRRYAQSTPSTINITKWYSRVYKRGLAIIDDVFVLDVLSSDKHGYIVQAMQVTMKDRAIVSATATLARVVATHGEAGRSLKLTWLTNEQ